MTSYGQPSAEEFKLSTDPFFVEKVATSWSVPESAGQGTCSVR